VRGAVRGDRILWLDENAGASVATAVWDALDALRLALNASMQLGLFSVEAHYALYPTGAGYRRHLDRFRASAGRGDVRVISFALYLNDAWMPADGGVLRIYDGERERDVLPVAATLACFLSERFEHEVLPSARDRLSLTGWFRRRP
jgi:SM-20-related protein